MAGKFALCKRLRRALTSGALRNFCRHTGGNIAIIFALATLPILGAVGAAVDYSSANRAKAQLDAIADATALSAVNLSAMSLSASTEQTNSVAYFKAQSASLRRPDADAFALELGQVVERLGRAG
jgi:Flp pilus assembly protein TadG